MLVFATFLSRETLHTIYFPNCHITLRSYFFARKLMKFINKKSCVIMENWNQTLCWKSFLRKFSVKSKTETKLCVTNQVCVTFENRKPNVVDKRCVDFFSSWKYNTAFNSGLKIWRVSGKSEMARLFNLKFFLYLCWFGFGSSPHFQAAKRCTQYIFRTYIEHFAHIFSHNNF